VISKAILDIARADPAISTAAGGSALIFAERGSEAMCVVIKQTGARRVTDTIPELRYSTVQVLVAGYPVEAGEALSEAIIEKIEGCEGTTIVTDENGDSRQYRVDGVAVINGPVLIFGADDSHFFSSNFLISYYRQN